MLFGPGKDVAASASVCEDQVVWLLQREQLEREQAGRKLDTGPEAVFVPSLGQAFDLDVAWATEVGREADPRQRLFRPAIPQDRQPGRAAD